MEVPSGLVAGGGLPAGGAAAAGLEGAGVAGGVGTKVIVEGTFVTIPGLLGTWGAQIPAR